MERLTETGIVYNFSKLDVAEIRWLERVQKRLAAYEDTGLEPERIQQLLAKFAEFVEVYEKVDFDYLRELIQRDKGMRPDKESLADRNCPRCGAGIPWDGLNESLEDAPDFCKYCGQRFDWEDEAALVADTNVGSKGGGQ